jgi:hypothetical protein
LKSLSGRRYLCLTFNAFSGQNTDENGPLGLRHGMEKEGFMECLHCGDEFFPNRDWQKFCCKECQQQWHRDRYRSYRHVVMGLLQSGLTEEQKQELLAPIAERAKEREQRRKMMRRVRNGNGQDRGTLEQREEASQRLAAMIEAHKPAPVGIKRRI